MAIFAQTKKGGICRINKRIHIICFFLTFLMFVLFSYIEPYIHKAIISSSLFQQSVDRNTCQYLQYITLPYNHLIGKNRCKDQPLSPGNKFHGHHSRCKDNVELLHSVNIPVSYLTWDKNRIVCRDSIGRMENIVSSEMT